MSLFHDTQKTLKLGHKISVFHLLELACEILYISSMQNNDLMQMFIPLTPLDEINIPFSLMMFITDLYNFL